MLWDETMLVVMRMFLEPMREGLISTFWTVGVVGAARKRAEDGVRTLQQQHFQALHSGIKWYWVFFSGCKLSRALHVSYTGL